MCAVATRHTDSTCIALCWPGPCAAQWLDFGFPDPASVQYPVMVSGVTQVAARNRWPINNLYIWVDYSSIPQVRGTGQPNTLRAALPTCPSVALTTGSDVPPMPPLPCVFTCNRGTSRVSSQPSTRSLYVRASRVCILARNSSTRD